ncbi:MAG: hypothetical protein HOO88_01420 [Kiritimatiellaceae bacterium]|nr:hypothetical protein [Kiritimatiellaceae bacterium]
MKSFAIILLFLFLAGAASAIVVADYATATNPPPGVWNVDWGYVYNYQGGSAVAVGSHWLLTAAHLANDGGAGTLAINGTNYYQQEIIFHAVANDPQHTSKADLALVRFDKPFPGYYPLYTNTFPTYPGHGQDKRLNVVLIGYGVIGTVSNNYYTARAYTDSSKGTKRWGTQKIDAPYTLSYDPDGVVGMTTNDGFRMDFSLSDTVYEAGLGTYDSGGGTFVNDGGTWKLAGINTVVYRVNVATPVDGLDRLFSVSMPAYSTWATNVMSLTGDLDGDGIPNYWEQQYGTTTGLVASADNDNDGFSNYLEYLADTNPTNPASFFEISGFLAAGSETIYFNGSTARQYQVFYATNDLAATNLIWIAANTNKVWGAGTNSSITVTNGDTKSFYRLRVNLP